MDWWLIPLVSTTALATSALLGRLARRPLRSRPARRIPSITKVLAIRPALPERRRNPALRAATCAITDMARTKERIRVEERQRWAARFAEAGGGDWVGWTPEALRQVELRASLEMDRRRQDREHAALVQRYARESADRAGHAQDPSWDGLHHTTCPYECDCPPAARRRP